MSKVYKEVKAGDPILAEDWNAIQRQIREHILSHTHTGVGESGAALDINLAALAANAGLDMRRLSVREALAVGDAGQPLLVVNPSAPNKEGSYQVNVAGTLRAEQVRTGRLDGITDLAVGSLTVTGGAVVGAPRAGKPQAPPDGLLVHGSLAVEGTLRATKVEGEGACVRGMIVMWSGAASALPAGWALCDGTNGTPDLRDRFIVGAGRQHGAGFAGEAGIHTHTVPQQMMAANTSEAGAHAHNMPQEWADQAAATGMAGPFGSFFNTVATGAAPVRAARTPPSGAHTHSFGMTFGASDTGPASGSVEPRWYALCLIMKT